MSADRVNLLCVGGVEGPSLYVDNHRVAGNKPWGAATGIGGEWDLTADEAVEMAERLLRGVGRLDPDRIEGLHWDGLSLVGES